MGAQAVLQWLSLRAVSFPAQRIRRGSWETPRGGWLRSREAPQGCSSNPPATPHPPAVCWAAPFAKTLPAPFSLPPAPRAGLSLLQQGITSGARKGPEPGSPHLREPRQAAEGRGAAPSPRQGLKALATAGPVTPSPLLV